MVKRAKWVQGEIFSAHEPIPLFVVRLEGPLALNQSKVDDLMFMVAQKFRAIEVFLTLQEIHTEPDPCPELNTMELQGERFDKLRAWAYAKAFTNPRKVVLVIGPGFKYGGEHYVTGLANRDSLGSHSIAYSCGMLDVGDEKQWIPSVVSAMHEVAHYLGAGHRNGNINVMHEDALRYSTESVPKWDHATKKQIYKSMGWK